MRLLKKNPSTTQQQLSLTYIALMSKLLSALKFQRTGGYIFIGPHGRTNSKMIYVTYVNRY